MKIVKENVGGGQAPATAQDLELIGALARKPLGPEEVYTFSVRLCDNEVDRDFERFTPQTLSALGPNPWSRSQSSATRHRAGSTARRMAVISGDFERVPPQTLEELAPMFVGKAGIFDHQWSARGQAARIYKTEIVREGGEDQDSPSIKGGMPVLATSCSKICRTGTWLSRTGLSAPMTLMSTSPTATKSRTAPSRPACIAADHS